MTADPRAVEIVGAAIGAHFDLRADASTGAWRYICDCGEVLPVDDINEANELHEEHQGASVLAALAAAGWSLLPPGGQPREVWRCLDLVSGGSFVTWSREALEQHCTAARSHETDPLGPPPHPWQHQVAQRTVWPDGREHTTPWQEAPSE